MKKALVLLIASLIVFSSLATVTIYGSINLDTQANVLKVSSQMYPTISSALAASEPNSIIQVSAGIYNENLHYDTNETSARKINISIIGEPGAVINGSVYLCGFEQLTFSGFVVTGELVLGDPHSPPGAVVNSTITGNTVYLTTFIGGPHNTLENNSLNGLVLKGDNTKMTWTTQQTLVKNNVITGGVIITKGSFSNQIDGNTISSADVGLSDTDLDSFYYPTGNNQITNNLFVGNTVGVSVYCSQVDQSNGSRWHLPDVLAHNTFEDNAVDLALYSSGNFSGAIVLDQNSFVEGAIQVRYLDAAAFR